MASKLDMAAIGFRVSSVECRKRRQMALGFIRSVQHVRVLIPAEVRLQLMHSAQKWVNTDLGKC